MIDNDDATVQAVRVTFKASKITAELLLSVLKAAEKAITAPIDRKLSTGSQSLKRLTKPGLQVNKLDFEQSGMDVKALKAAAREYGLDFHLRRLENGSWQLWYRSKDAELLKSAMEQVVRRQMNRSPAVKEQMQESLEKAKTHENERVQTAQNMEKGDRVIERGMER